MLTAMQACFDRKLRVRSFPSNHGIRRGQKKGFLPLFLCVAWAALISLASLSAQGTVPAVESPSPAISPPAEATSPVPAAAAKSVPGEPNTDAATEPAETPTGGADSRHVPRRPTLTDDDYKALAAYLRTAYAKPAAEWPKPEGR